MDARTSLMTRACLSSTILLLGIARTSFADAPIDGVQVPDGAILIYALQSKAKTISDVPDGAILLHPSHWLADILHRELRRARDVPLIPPTMSEAARCRRSAPGDLGDVPLIPTMQAEPERYVLDAEHWLQVADQCPAACEGEPVAPHESLPTRPPAESFGVQSADPAEVILELMQHMDESVLDGTVFQEGQADCAADECDARRSARAALLDILRGFEDQAACDPQHSNLCVETHEEVHREHEQHDATDNVPPITALREAGRQLECTAELLEAQDLFPQADHLRELARDLRETARHARIHEIVKTERLARIRDLAASKPPVGTPRPHHPHHEDAQLDRIEHQLRHVAELLESIRGNATRR